MTRDDRALLALHAGLVVGGAVAIALPVPAQGWAVLAVVACYVAGLGLLARARRRADWLALWLLLVPVSVVQVLPDWVLADVLGTLRFPDTGGLRVGDAVPLAMAGMWVTPLFVVALLAKGRPAAGAALAVLVFGAAELTAPVLDLWEPTGDTTRVAGVAVYVIAAEAVLGWAVVTAANAVRGAGAAKHVGAALAVGTTYTGALVLAYFLLEVADWRLVA